jgi:hypothetical protein
MKHRASTAEEISQGAKRKPKKTLDQLAEDKSLPAGARQLASFLKDHHYSSTEAQAKD